MSVWRPSSPSAIPHPALLAALLAVSACTKTPEPPADAGSDAAVDMGADVRVDLGPEPDSGPGADVDMASACTYSPAEIETIDAPTRIHTPRWAFLPWISKDISDTADTYAFVQGFIDRDIPVGTVVLDSPWATNYNTFIPSPTRYPNFGQMVADLRAQDVRVVLWVTQFTNEASFDLERGGDRYDGPASNFAEAQACGFFINEGRLYTWWKGRGGSIDFFNPTAVQWWHEQQKPLLDLGIAGWKLDFGESYVRTDTVQTAAGEMPHQAYSEQYYKDYYDYGISQRGDEEFVTMVRAWDESYDLPGRFFARPEHAPVVWVGDNRRDWVGLADALDHTFRSAAAGYVVIGSDLGGYLNRDDKDLGVNIPFDRTNFMRWLAVSAMSPFMQLHGRENLTPWTLPNDPNPDESVELYRFWSHVHAELVPFLYSFAQEAYLAGGSMIRPIGEESQWAGDYRYMLGEAFLVAPILDETGVREVEVPQDFWFDFWTGEYLEGGTTVTFDYSGSLREIPLLVRAGSIVPIESASAVAGLTEGNLGGADVVLTYGWRGEPTEFRAHDPDGATTDYTVGPVQGGPVRFTASRARRQLVVRLGIPRDAVASVTVNGAAATEVATEAELMNGAHYRVVPPYVWVSSPARDQPVEMIVVPQQP